MTDTREHEKVKEIIGHLMGVVKAACSCPKTREMHFRSIQAILSWIELIKLETRPTGKVGIPKQANSVYDARFYARIALDGIKDFESAFNSKYRFHLPHVIDSMEKAIGVMLDNWK